MVGVGPGGKFPRIPRHVVIAALEFLGDKVNDERTGRGPLRFSFARSRGKSADSFVTGNVTCFKELWFECILHFTKFELKYNTKFVCLSSVLMQVAVVPIGGTCSAQLASLALVAREIEYARPIPRTPSVRYRDNFLAKIIVRRSKLHKTWEEAIEARAKILQKCVEKLTSVKSTIEPYGWYLDFFGVSPTPAAK